MGPGLTGCILGLWDTETANGGGDAIMCMVVSEVSNILVTANKDRTVRVFKILADPQPVDESYD